MYNIILLSIQTFLLGLAIGFSIIKKKLKHIEEESEELNTLVFTDEEQNKAKRWEIVCYFIILAIGILRYILF